jgi:hypothetical protein
MGNGRGKCHREDNYKTKLGKDVTMSVCAVF